MNLVQLVKDTDSSNEQTRFQAEDQLVKARNSDPCLFILACSQNFSDGNLESHLRLKCGMLVKYTLSNTGVSTEEVWMSFPESSREQIKNNILSNLVFPNDSIQNTSISIVSIIWEVEFPRGKWTHLIQTLTQNAFHHDENIKKVAVAALESIASTIREKNFVLDEENIRQILSGFFSALQENKNQQITINAVRGLKNILFVAQETFIKKETRQAIMDPVIQCAINGEKSLKVEAMGFFCAFLETFYDYFQDFCQPIWEITSSLLTNSDVELATSAVRVWITIVGEYKTRVSKQDNRLSKVVDFELILQIIQAMIPILLESLLKNAEINEQEEHEEEEISVITETRECLRLITIVTGSFMIQYAVKFLETYIISSNSFEVLASLIVYSSILDESSLDLPLSPIVYSILPVLVNIVTYCAGMKVKEEASFALKVTAKVIPQIFFEPEYQSKLLPLLASLVESKPEISKHITQMWHYLAEDMAKSKQIWNINFDLCSLIDLLLVNVSRDISWHHYSLLDHSFLAIQSLVLCLPNEALKIKYIKILVETVKNLGKMDDQRRNFILSGALSCIQIALYRVQINDNLDAKLCQEIIGLIDENLTKNKETETEAIYVLAGLASAMGPSFEVYFDKAWTYIKDRLHRHNQGDLLLAVSSAIVEISTACPHKLDPYLGEIFSNLCNFINDPNAERNIKIKLIYSIGDIILGCKESVAPFITELLRVYEQAMNASILIVKMDNLELEDFLNQLRNATIESLITFFWGTNECSKIKDEILKFLPSILQFVQRICARESNPTQVLSISKDLVKQCMTLLNDIIIIYKPSFTDQLVQDVQELKTKISSLFA